MLQPTFTRPRFARAVRRYRAHTGERRWSRGENTLPVEFDATARAKRLVADMGLVAPGEETEGMNKVLNAAALTYVAAFIGALAQFLYYAVQVMGRRE